MPLKLLGHVAKFTEKGAITLSAWRDAWDANAWIAVRISYSGIGMSLTPSDN